MKRLLAFALHATAAAIMAWGWFSLGTEESRWIEDLKGGYTLFLTNQGLLIALSCMAVSLLSDTFPSVTSLRDTKRALLMLSMPLEFVISTIYWTLLLLFPHLIVPVASHGASASPGAALVRLPLGLDLALHASPLLAVLIDFFVFQPKFSKTYVHRIAPVAVIAFAVWYASFVEYCAVFNNDFFPYPFLTHSPFPGRVLIYTIVAGIALGCFRVLNALHP